MKGRKPIPTRLKLLNNEPNKDRINRNEPKPRPGLPTCPAHLSKTARTEWKRIVPELDALGLLTKIDRAVLAAYCQAYGRWVEAEEKLKELPAVGMSGGSKKTTHKKNGDIVVEEKRGQFLTNPWLWVANKAIDQMNRTAVEFGFTPSSRSRINVNKPDDDNEFF